MEEKKLTDEEILNDLQLFSNLEIEEAKKQGAEKAVLLATLTLDLIRRLQQRVSILEADNDDYKMKLAENELVSIDWHNEQVGHLEEENAELQKQVDELKAENTELYKEHTTLIAGSILQKEQVKKDTAKEIIEKILGYIGSNQKFCIVDEGHKTLIDCDKLFGFIEQLAKEQGVEVE